MVALVYVAWAADGTGMQRLQQRESLMSAAGTWKLAMQTPIGERMVTLTLHVAGADLTGRMSAEDGNAVDIYDGKLAGSTASWKANIKNPMPLTLEFAGDVDGERMSGTVSAAVGSWPFTGTKGA
jgi:hypothetical protein